MRFEPKNIRLVAATLAVTLCAVLSAGCLFDTRSAEPPNKNIVNQIPLDDPTDVFASMKDGLEGDASSNYERALSDQFIFSPLSDDSLNVNFVGTDVYNNWTKEVERDVTGLLLSETDTLEFDFQLTRLIDENDFVRFETTYSLRTVTGQTVVTYKGVAHIDVRLENGIWQVVYWDEMERVPGFDTWGLYRGFLRQRLQ